MIMDEEIELVAMDEKDGKVFIEKCRECFIGELESTETTQSPGIFRVPPKLLDVGKSAFLPEIFSFGPFYQKEYELYDNFKRRLLQSLYGDKFREIKGSKTTDKDLESQSSIWYHFWPKKKRQSQSRNMVVPLEEIFKAASKSFQKTQEWYKVLKENYYAIDRMVLDGCFIVELLCFYNKSTTGDDKEKELDVCGRTGSDSLIFQQRWLLPALQRDLIKLENQFPFFLLEEFFRILTPGSDEPSSLKDLFVKFFRSKFSLKESIYKLDPSPTRKYAHPLDLFRSLFIFSFEKKQEGDKVHQIFIDSPKLIYSAQELKEAGVKIVEKKDSHLLDISFDRKKKVLRIPQLVIDENMTVALLNFVAYEQCDHSQSPYFINYLLFLDSLINTTKDVEILRKERIIRYPLGTEKEVVDLFNNFCKGMLYSFDQTYLSVNMEALNEYCTGFYSSCLCYWWSNLRRDKCSSPWTSLSLVAAIVLLILTMLQTFFTIFPYYHPN